MAGDAKPRNVENSDRSRRRFLRYAGLLGAAGVAGCLGDDEDPDEVLDDDDDTTVDDDDDDTVTADPIEFNAIAEDSGIPTEQQFNPYGQNVAMSADRIPYEKLGSFDLKTYLEEGDAQWIPMAAEEWDVPDQLTEGTTVSVTAASDRTWHDGDEITAEDLYTHFRLMYHFGAELFNSVDPDSLDIVDDKTVEMEVSQSTNPRILKMDMIGYQYGERFNTKASIFGEYLEAIEEAEDDEEVDEAMQELSEFEMEKPVGTGWGTLSDATEEMLIYETVDDHPVGGEMDFDIWTDRHVGDAQQAYQRALAGEIDFLGEAGPETVANQLAGGGYNLFSHTYLSSSALQFNLGREPWDDVYVRKAIAYAVDLEKATAPIAVEGPWGQLRDPAPSPPTGLMVGEEQYLGDLIDGFESYSPYEADAEAAADMMEAGGYSRDSDGNWVHDGEVLTVPITVYSDWTHKATYITPVQDDLRAAGFEPQINAIPASEAFGDTFEGNYDVVQGFWGQSWHPITMFDIFHPDQGWMALNPPEEFEVPMPVGDPGGELEAVNVRQLVEDLRAAGPIEEEREVVQELAWVFNQTLPQIPVFLGYSGAHLKDDWTISDWDEWDRKVWDGEWEIFNLGLVEQA